MGVGGAVDEAHLKVVLALGAAEPDGGFAVFGAPGGVGPAGPDAVEDAGVGEGGGEGEGAEGGDVGEHALQEGPLAAGERRSEMCVCACFEVASFVH